MKIWRKGGRCSEWAKTTRGTGCTEHVLLRSARDRRLPQRPGDPGRSVRNPTEEISGGKTMGRRQLSDGLYYSQAVWREGRALGGATCRGQGWREQLRMISFYKCGALPGHRCTFVRVLICSHYRQQRKSAKVLRVHSNKVFLHPDWKTHFDLFIS